MNNKISDVLKELNISSVIISDANNLRYLSGFSGGEGYLYISSEKHILLTDSRYTLQAKNEADGWEIIEASGNGYLEKLKDIAENDSKIGFENNNISYNEYLGFKNIFGDKLCHLDSNIDKLRTVKNDKEIEYIKKAAEIADKVFLKVLNKISKNVTEKEIAAYIDYNLKLLGADGNSFDTIVASGENSAMPHAVPTDKKIASGDFITMDFGCKVNGYCSDMTRTVVFGKASLKQKEIYDTVLEAQVSALNNFKAGAFGRDIDKISRDIIKNAGYGEYFGHGLGHSVGLFIHESPRLSPSESGTIPENCVITVEPGIYMPGFGGVRIEDLVVVKNGGIENITHSDKNLIEL